MKYRENIQTSNCLTADSQSKKICTTKWITFEFLKLGFKTFLLKQKNC